MPMPCAVLHTVMDHVSSSSPSHVVDAVLLQPLVRCRRGAVVVVVSAVAVEAVVMMAVMMRGATLSRCLEAVVAMTAAMTMAMMLMMAVLAMASSQGV